jgi:hypothetical protein
MPTDDTGQFDVLLKWISAGGATAVIGVLYTLYKFIWLPYIKVRDADNLIRAEDNRLSKIKIRILSCFLDHLKKEGYPIEVPNIPAEEI